jgi:hypothetical protein
MVFSLLDFYCGGRNKCEFALFSFAFFRALFSSRFRALFSSRFRALFSSRFRALFCFALASAKARKKRRRQPLLVSNIDNSIISNTDSLTIILLITNKSNGIPSLLIVT